MNGEQPISPLADAKSAPHSAFWGKRLCGGWPVQEMKQVPECLPARGALHREAAAVDSAVYAHARRLAVVINYI